MDNRGKQDRAADGALRPQTTSSTSGKGRLRYKPLAPKESSSSTAQGSGRSQSGRESHSPKNELTFFNVTNPAQSRTQEARKFVRTQVMRTYAKEKKMQKSRSEIPPKGQLFVATPAASLHSVQELFSKAAIGPSTAAMMSQPPFGSPSQFLARPGVTPSRPHSPSGWNVPRWPIDADPRTDDLLRHCYSSAFRASNPLYMISLLVQRPFAEIFPLSIDIDADERFGAGAGQAPRSQNEIFRFAGKCPALAHALCMIAASDLSLRQVNKVLNDHQVIYHKSKALFLLNHTIQGLTEISWPAVLATIAVLASHELIVGDYKAWTVHMLGFSRIIDMNGGIASLPQDNLVRRLILWSDQIGALFMSMRPLFLASDVLSDSSRVRTNVSATSATQYDVDDSSGELFRFLRDSATQRGLQDVIHDISCVAKVGSENLSTTIPPATQNLVSMRDSILHRLLYLAPETQEGDDDLSQEECLRLALLLLTLDRLFSPVLPSAYFQVTHMVADRLASGLGGADDWDEHEWMTLWICLIGTSVSSNNARTRSVFISAAADIARDLFTGPRELTDEAVRGLAKVIPGSRLYEEGEMAAFAADVRAECAVEGD